MNEHGLARLLSDLACGGADRPEAAAPTPSCPPLPRIRSALLREDWTEAEEHHRRGCGHCQTEEARARRQVWHPTWGQLFEHARNLPGGGDADLTYHLQRDVCRRCQRLASVFQADRLLGRLAAQVRQGLAGAADRLGKVLASGVLAPIAATSAPEQHLAFEGADHTGTLHRTTPRLRLELRGDAGAPPLLRVLIEGRKEVTEHFLVARPRKEPGTLTAELRPGRLPSEASVLALYEVDAAALDREDVEPLRAAFAAGKGDPATAAAWRAWAAAGLKLSGLDAAVRSALQDLTRPDAGRLPAER